MLDILVTVYLICFRYFLREGLKKSLKLQTLPEQGGGGLKITPCV